MKSGIFGALLFGGISFLTFLFLGYLFSFIVSGYFEFFIGAGIGGSILPAFIGFTSFSQ